VALLGPAPCGTWSEVLVSSRGEVCFKLLIVLCTICGLHAEIHQMLWDLTLLCHMIITTTLETSALVVLNRFWLRNLFPLLEFATWLAGSIGLAFAS
jgi:hypothetical protein